MFRVESQVGPYFGLVYFKIELALGPTPRIAALGKILSTLGLSHFGFVFWLFPSNVSY